MSEGVGADDLRAAAGSRPDVTVLGYQPAEDMSEVLGQRRRAGRAARARRRTVLGAQQGAQLPQSSAARSSRWCPQGNPAAQDVTAAGGCAADPTAEGVGIAADWIAAVTSDPAELPARAARARNLAERRFDIAAIGARFESIFESALADTHPRGALRRVSTLAAEPGSVA